MARCLGGMLCWLVAPWKFNLAPENIPSQKERIVFHPSFFRGELLNFGGCTIWRRCQNVVDDGFKKNGYQFFGALYELKEATPGMS